MAGAGLKNFGTEVLTSNDVDQYLMQQTVMTFASDAARTSAFTAASLSPSEGMVAYLSDTNQIQVYNGSSWISVNNATVEAISVQSTGLVQIPYQPMFAGRRSGANVTSGVWIVNDVYTNRGNHYNASTGVFTCPTAGAYAMHWQGIAYRSPGYGYCDLEKNNVATGMFGHWNLNADSWANPSVHGVIVCAQNDTIRFAIRTVGGNGGAYGSQHNSAAIYFLG